MGPGKKRKRREEPEITGTITVSSAGATDLPPIIASTVGVSIPQLPFQPYTRPIATDIPKKKYPRPEYLLHGHNQRLDYEGRELLEDLQYQRYYIGIFDPETQAVELHVAPKVHITSAIKAHKQRDLEVQTKGSKFTFEESRVALGKAFGTRKAQNLLTSREINKVDVTDMDKSVGSAIVSQVEESTKVIPSIQELGKAMLDERPIPKYNQDAIKVGDIYKREDLISEEEWESMWVTDWVKNGDVQTKSTHVNNRAMAFLQDTQKKHTRNLKVLKYVSFLIDFYLYQQKTQGRLPAIGKIKFSFYGTGISPIILEEFYNKFAEKTTVDGAMKANDNGQPKEYDRFRVSPRLEQKILYYLAVLCLMVDQWDVDLFDLKHDLNIAPRELGQAFREVGCSVKELSKTQYATMQITKADALQHKRAVLKVPLVFPNPPRKRTTTGRK